MGCGKSFKMPYGQGESYWVKCGVILHNPEEVVLCDSCEKVNKIFYRMIELEKESESNPNKIMTYKILWDKLKEELQFNRI